ncbi:MAG: hypothetical protein M1167_01215, partial [Chloroflexi bacterium]|nr:hypothetical protein [Chloroflexota bacterium]
LPSILQGLKKIFFLILYGLAPAFPNHLINHLKVAQSPLEGQDKQGNSCPAKLNIPISFSADLSSIIFLVCFSNSPDTDFPS